MSSMSFCSNCGVMTQSTGTACSKCNRSLSPAYLGAASGGSSAGTAVRNSAGFWIRLVAYLIDFIVICLVSVTIGALIGFAAFAAGLGKSPVGHALLILVLQGIGFSIAVLYEVVLIQSAWQATLGKRILGLKVIDEYDSRLSPSRSIGRFFGKALSGMTLGIGYLMIGFMDQKRGLHDLVAGTRVVKL